MTILRIALVAVAVGMSASAAAATDGSAFMLAGTPKLYAVQGHDRLGQPVAYVTLRGDRHLHDPRLVFAQVAGVSGRTYASRPSRTCLRVSFINEGDDGVPRRLVSPGRRYRVTVRLRAVAGGASKLIATFRLKAAPLKSSAKPPRC
jgi:hypothetical protein